MCMASSLGVVNTRKIDYSYSICCGKDDGLDKEDLVVSGAHVTKDDGSKRSMQRSSETVDGQIDRLKKGNYLFICYCTNLCFCNICTMVVTADAV